MVDEARGRSRPPRRVRGVVAALVGVGLLVGGAARAECPIGQARGESGDRLRVGFAPMAPFVVPAGSDGQVRGFAIDLLRTLAAREGWTLELVELSPDTLRERIADCQLDLGAGGRPTSATLAESVDFSRPYFSTVTTAVVHQDDPGRATPSAGKSPGGRLAHAGARGLVWGLVALVLLALASWMLNVASGWHRRGVLRWRRADPSVSGPLAALGWLWRSSTGRVLVVLWIAVGLVLGTTGRTSGAIQPLVLGEDPLRGLVEQAAHTEKLVGERYPDGDRVSCSADALKACFRGFADGTLAAVAGPREVLCSQVLDLALDRVVLRDDLSVPEQYAFLLPPGSPLRLALDRALLRLHEDSGGHQPIIRCPGDPR